MEIVVKAESMKLECDSGIGIEATVDLYNNTVEVVMQDCGDLAEADIDDMITFLQGVKKVMNDPPPVVDVDL